MMKISVITICYNSERFIEKTIASVISQTYPEMEYVIIDGGSEDGTVDIIKRYETKIHYWVSEIDGGIYEAMNKGLGKVTGDWVIFMNSGDCFYDHNIVKKIFSQEINNGVNIIYGDVVIMTKERVYKKALPLKDISWHQPFCHQSAFIRKDVAKSFPYNTKYRIAADYDFFYHIYFIWGDSAFLYLPFAFSVCDGTDSFCHKNNYKMWKEYMVIRSEHKDWRWHWHYLKNKMKDILGYE